MTQINCFLLSFFLFFFIFTYARNFFHLCIYFISFFFIFSNDEQINLYAWFLYYSYIPTLAFIARLNWGNTLFWQNILVDFVSRAKPLTRIHIFRTEYIYWKRDDSKVRDYGRRAGQRWINPYTSISCRIRPCSYDARYKQKVQRQVLFEPRTNGRGRSPILQAAG